ncbi:hypothetical protein LX95_01295 [Mesonia algae]|uniref:Uncharacterized protein n=1 Tax=Mesonia algae TaxID=213248 RepID=A0A2W7I4K6_9FLAO|nr:hypothetical protein [Mesonia algae]PZW41614.1 hypothetical protein LX95_01295 [Mesonia algae]
MEQSIRNHNAATNLAKSLAGERRFSGDLNSLASNGAIRVVGHTHFVKKDISSLGGRNKILDENTKKVDGVSTISDNKLPKNEAFIFDTVAIAHGVGSASKMGDVKFETAFPAALQNAVLSIKQLGNVIMERPVSDFYAKADPQSPGEKVLNLGSPHVLRDDEAIDFEITFPSGTSMADAASAGNELLAEFKLIGYVTRRSSN